MMFLTSDTYVPAIRWRQGEYQALLRLRNDAKARIVPFITIPEIEFDFELWQPKKTVHEHVHPFSARYKKKWEKRPAWISVNKTIVQTAMDNGQDIFSYVFDDLREFGAQAVPAISLDADPKIIAAVAKIVKQDNLGVAVVIRLEDLMKPDANARIQGLMFALKVAPSITDLIVDLGAPNFEPYDVFSGALIFALSKLGNLEAYRNFVVIGTAIPETFKDVSKGTKEITRHDWLFYQAFITKLPISMRRPNFGDYTVVHPEFTAVDMRKIKSAGKIIYTTPGNWSVLKGGSFRDNPDQMYGHCANLVSKAIFKGAGYSNGDDYIAKCAIKAEGPSNQTRWKEVAINHHITQVVDDLAKLSAET